MKSLFAGLFILFMFTASAQEKTHLWERDMKQAAETSITTGKPLLLFYTGSDWCGACKRLFSEVFEKPEFEKWAKENVILVELDYPRNKQPDPRYVEQNNLMKEIFGVSSYPTIVFVTPVKRNDKIYYNRIGSMGYMPGGPEVWLAAAAKIVALNTATKPE